MPERTVVGSFTQLGTEVTAGTPVAANRQLQSITVMVRDTPKTIEHALQGAKHPANILLAQESTEATLKGWPTYAADVYIWSMLYGAATISTPTGAVNLRKWLWQPNGIGPDTPQSMTVQNGSSVRAHQFAYGLLNDYGWKWTRKDITSDGKLIGQLLSDNIVLTASPTIIADVPVAPDDLHVYLDTSSANLGTTRLTRVYSCDFTPVTNKWTPNWPSDRTHMDWSVAVDTIHKNETKLLVQADSNGMAILANLRSFNAQGSNPTYYLRLQHQGAVAENNWQVSLGSPSAGTFTLTFKGQTTSTIAFNATAAAVASALQALSSIGATGCTVSGGTGGPYIVTFTGALSQDTTDALTGNGTGLTGGTFVITQFTQFFLQQNDVAVKIADVAELKDEEGVWAIEYTLVGVYDPVWGHTHIVTMQNLLSAL